MMKMYSINKDTPRLEEEEEEEEWINPPLQPRLPPQAGADDAATKIAPVAAVAVESDGDDDIGGPDDYDSDVRFCTVTA